MQFWRLSSPTVCNLQASDPAGGVTQYQVWRPEGQGRWWCRFQSGSEGLRAKGTEAGEDRCLSSSKKAGRKRGKFLLRLPFLLFRPSVDSMMPTHIAEDSLFYWVHPLKCSSHLETSSQTHPEIMFNLSSPWPVKLTIRPQLRKWKNKTHQSENICRTYIW